MDGKITIEMMVWAILFGNLITGMIGAAAFCVLMIIYWRRG